MFLSLSIALVVCSSKFALPILDEMNSSLKPSALSNGNATIEQGGYRVLDQYHSQPSKLRAIGVGAGATGKKTNHVDARRKYADAGEQGYALHIRWFVW
jgi:hypothetical protein